ncbi:120_t:CDS:1, partial [Gigaspora rosea]
NIIFGISPIYNGIVVDLTHTDDIANEAFINGTLSFGPIILMNYLKYDDSLTLNSTFDSPTTRPRTKRHINIIYQGGEGVAFLNDNLKVDLKCSVAFFAYNNQTGERYLLTSGRCFPTDAELFYHVPWDHPISSTIFGRLQYTSYTNADFTMIKKIDNSIDFTPQIRSSDNLFPSLYIERFEFDNPPAIGQHICMSGYVINIICGRLTSTSSYAGVPSINGTGLAKYNYMLKMELFGANIHDIDRGGTVFSYFPSTEYQLVVVYGHVTYAYTHLSKALYGGNPIAVTPIRRLRSHTHDNITFIDLRTYQP